MSVQQHSHSGGTGDGKKIKWKDIDGKPNLNTNTGPQFANGQVILSVVGDTVINCGFKPKFISFETFASRSAGSNKYSGSHHSGTCDSNLNNKVTGFGNMSNDVSLGNAYRTNNNSSKCVYAWTYDTTNHYSYGSVTAISSTNFTLNVGQVNDTMEVIWKAFG